MKKHNPNTPIMLREAAGTQPKVYARYEFGREVSEDLAGRWIFVLWLLGGARGIEVLGIDGIDGMGEQEKRAAPSNEWDGCGKRGEWAIGVDFGARGRGDEWTMKWIRRLLTLPFHANTTPLQDYQTKRSKKKLQDWSSNKHEVAKLATEWKWSTRHREHGDGETLYISRGLAEDRASDEEPNKPYIMDSWRCTNSRRRCFRAILEDRGVSEREWNKCGYKCTSTSFPVWELLWASGSLCLYSLLSSSLQTLLRLHHKQC